MQQEKLINKELVLVSIKARNSPRNWGFKMIKREYKSNQKRIKAQSSGL